MTKTSLRKNNRSFGQIGMWRQEKFTPKMWKPNLMKLWAEFRSSSMQKILKRPLMSSIHSLWGNFKRRISRLRKFTITNWFQMSWMITFRWKNVLMKWLKFYGHLAWPTLTRLMCVSDPSNQTIKISIICTQNTMEIK